MANKNPCIRPVVAQNRQCLVDALEDMIDQEVIIITYEENVRSGALTVKLLGVNRVFRYIGVKLLSSTEIDPEGCVTSKPQKIRNATPMKLNFDELYSANDNVIHAVGLIGENTTPWLGLKQPLLLVETINGIQAGPPHLYKDIMDFCDLAPYVLGRHAGLLNADLALENLLAYRQHAVQVNTQAIVYHLLEPEVHHKKRLRRGS